MIPALIDHLWQSTLFCGGAWLITLMLRPNRAALRHSIWLLASLKFLVPFSLLFSLGTTIGLPAARIADNQPLMLGDALQSVSLLVSPTGALRAAESGAALRIALAAIWMVGALIIAARWLLAWREANELVRAARPAPGAPANARITNADIEPAVARVFHPVVLLPAALLGRLSERELSTVLAHEHEHIARRDNLTASLHRLVETLFWFHPAVWWIGRQMLEERERACDEAVLDSGHARTDYAAGILAVCRHCRESASVSAAATGGSLTRRVRYILGDGHPATLGLGKALLLLVATVGIAATPLFAGAITDATHRQQLLTANSLALGTADISIGPAAIAVDLRPRVIANQNGVLIRNSTLRDLIAIAYGVETWKVYGGDWLDAPRYDVRAVARVPVSEPDDLDPYALREIVTKLLVSRFDAEIHVNRRCQSPCGRYALAAVSQPR
jgi:beta-lactamase regulating signal transducer with metallopeptidase domain